MKDFKIILTPNGIEITAKLTSVMEADTLITLLQLLKDLLLDPVPKK